MRTRAKFISQLLQFSLKDIKRLEVKFDPFHRNSLNIREFYQGATSKRSLKTNLECTYKANIVCDNSDPIVNVKFQDDHQLIINSKYLESPQIIQIINQFKEKHARIEDEQ